MSTSIIPGAEPISIEDGPAGAVLLLHGYMGTVQTVSDWALAFAQAGFAVEAPLLPGHGTSVEEMAMTRWPDYVRCAEAFYKKLTERYDRVFVGGLCTGGTLAALLTIWHPETTAGLIAINGFFKIPGHWKKAQAMQDLLASDRKFFPWFHGKSMEDPNATPLIAYEQSPIATMLSLKEGREEACQRLGEIHCPTLVFTSLVSPQFATNETPWFEDVSGPVEHVGLERSNHVATLDYDKGIIETRSVSFALAVTKNERDQAQQEVA